MAVAVLFLTFLDVLAKDLATRYDPIQVVWARFMSQTGIVFALLAPRLHILMRTKHLGSQIIRSIFMLGATVAFFISLKHLPLVTTTAVFEVAPLLITVAAFLFLGERFGIRRWIGVGIGMLGAMIIIRPGSDVFQWMSLVPLIAALCFAGYAIVTRMVGQDESPWTSLLYSALIGALVVSFVVPSVWIAPKGWDIFKMIAIGGVGAIGHFLLIRSFTLAEASFLAPIGYLSLVYTTFWGFFLFAETPDLYVILGAAIVVCAGLYVWHRENQVTSSDD
jgi:drug/metabolite transporter (DMT)-like permease